MVPRLPFPLVCIILLLTASPAGQAPVRYVYDELGRLVAVIDANGDSAVYHYDPVGNLLSITRAGPTDVSIIEFTPDAGPTGATVTIYGTGFSATAAQNAVSFNGTAATVVSAMPAELVVTVPTGATTGPISVTSPNGSANSGSNFVVGSPGAPSIVSFTPAAGVAGTTVDITGTNFDAVLANNRTRFNVTRAGVSDVAATTLSASVPPGTGSGRIEVITPFGTAISTDDFIIPPPPYVPADVFAHGRIPLDVPTVVTVSTASKIALNLFDGTPGQRVSILGTNGVTGQILGCDIPVSLLNPHASLLGGPTCMEGSGFMDTKALPLDGTYTILADPGGAATGSVTLTVYDVPPDFSGAIQAGGPSVVASMSTPGQNGSLSFAGAAGQRVSVLGDNGIGGQVGLTCDVNVSILNADASELVAPACMEGGGFIDVATLAAAGTYKLFVNPASWATGNLALTLYDVPADFNAGITAAGSAVTVPITVPGQNGTLTFTGTAGQRISLEGTNGMFGQIGLACDVNVSVLQPDGSQLVGPTCMEGSGFIGATTLPATGTYTVFVNPERWAIGNLSLTLYDVTDFTGTITPGGSAVTVSLPTPGQNGQLTFTGTAGQRISLLGTDGMNGQVFGCDLQVSILNPDTSQLAAPTCMEGSGFIDVKVLPSSGTYTILADPVGSATGDITLTLFDVTDFTGTITPGGSAVTVTMPTPGQNGQVTFTGTAGQRISLLGTSGLSGQVFGCDLQVSIRSPDTSQLAAPACMEGSGFIDVRVLPASGTYTILADPAGAATGNVTLTLYDVPADTTGTVSIGGPSIAVPLGTPGQNGTLTFAGTSGQQVTVSMTGNTFGTTTVRLLKPDGSQMAAATSAGASFNLATQTLPATGTYTIAIDPGGSNTGSLNVSVTTP